MLLLYELDTNLLNSFSSIFVHGSSTFSCGFKPSPASSNHDREGIVLLYHYNSFHQSNHAAFRPRKPGLSPQESPVNCRGGNAPSYPKIEPNVEGAMVVISVSETPENQESAIHTGRLAYLLLGSLGGNSHFMLEGTMAAFSQPRFDFKEGRCPPRPASSPIHNSSFLSYTSRDKAQRRHGPFELCYLRFLKSRFRFCRSVEMRAWSRDRCLSMSQPAFLGRIWCTG
jgi:hypothetical protein